MLDMQNVWGANKSRRGNTATQNAQEIYANIGPFSKSVHVHVHVCQSDIPTTRWLLSRLHLYFDNMLEVQCRHRRYGTLVYHNSCDLVQALSSALGKSDTKTKNTNNEPNTEDQVQQHSTPPPPTSRAGTRTNCCHIHVYED